MHTHTSREEGQQIILVSLMLPILLVFVGLVIDVGNLYFHRRMAQNAADAAAVAGSIQLSIDATTASNTALAYADNNGYSISGSNTVTVEIEDGCVTVRITEQVRPLLVSLIWNGTFAVPAEAVACMQQVQLPTVVLLAETGQALYMNGNSSLIINKGGLHINSRNDKEDAVEIDGKAYIETETTSTAYSKLSKDAKQAFRPEIEDNTGITIPDPLKDLPAPPKGSCTDLKDITKDRTLQPGCYKGGFNVKNATLTLSPGHYWIEDGISLSGKATIIGNGVMLYFADSEEVDLRDCYKCSFTPPSTEEYAGIIFFGSRTEGPTFKFKGELVLKGILYNPNGAVELTGNADIGANLAVSTLQLTGGAKLTMEGYSSPQWGTTEFRMTK